MEVAAIAGQGKETSVTLKGKSPNEPTTTLALSALMEVRVVGGPLLATRRARVLEERKKLLLSKLGE